MLTKNTIVEKMSKNEEETKTFTKKKSEGVNYHWACLTRNAKITLK